MFCVQILLRNNKFSVNIMIYIGLFLLIWAFAFFGFSLYKIRVDHCCKLASSMLIARQLRRSFYCFASSVNLMRIVKILVFYFPLKSARTALVSLLAGRVEAAVKFCNTKNLLFEAAILEAYVHPKSALEKLKKFQSNAAKIECADICFMLNDKEAAENFLENITDKNLTPYYKAKKAYLEANFFLFDANMESASHAATLAAVNYKKSHAYIEEAYAYLLQGTIFRISAVEDAAHFMFRKAATLFRAFHNFAGEADAYANLGMLWTLRENFEAALGYFKDSFEINKTHHRKSAAAYVLTQSALVELLAKNFRKAETTAKRALKRQKKLHDKNGQAFAWQILAYLFSAQKKWDKMRDCAQEAYLIYQKNNLDVSCLLESAYLWANAEFELGNVKKAESLLRKCTDKNIALNSCFHVANAYNLLGLIFLKKNDLSRAKSLFLTAASIEQKDERFAGAATDYINIALIENRRGHMQQALKTFQTALNFAGAFEENDLTAFIQKKIYELENKLK